jgi:hypothetical protein
MYSKLLNRIKDIVKSAPHLKIFLLAVLFNLICLAVEQRYPGVGTALLDNTFKFLVILIVILSIIIIGITTYNRN